MKFNPWALLRDARYALPRTIESHMHGPDAADAARICGRLHREGLDVTIGYFQSSHATPADIVAANQEVSALLASRRGGAYLSVKAPPLAFDATHLETIAEAAAAARLSLMFDAHSPGDADRTLDALERLLPAYPGTGCVLPARWGRSLADTLRFRDTSARIRIVKGEWTDPEWNGRDIEAGYLALVSSLAGRAAPVAIATHKPELAERALNILLAADTPCELEQLRGLPRRRTMAIARRLGVPVRIYVPFGPGWWPYAVDKALARPHLLSWMIADLMGKRDTFR